MLLMFYHNINPILLKLGPLEIRYYGLFFVISIILAYYLLIYLSKKNNLNLTKSQVSDYLFCIILSAIITARFFHVFIYHFDYYSRNLIEIFFIWQGGLSFHGGFLGAILAGYYYCKKNNLNFLKMADITMIPLSIGLAFGRLANFINGEIPGTITNIPWAVKFPNYQGFRHPVQIYESFKNFFIFSTLWFLKNKNLKTGTLFFTFIFMYSILRFFLEFFKDPQGFSFLGLTLGQILTIIMFSIALIYYIKIRNKR